MEPPKNVVELPQMPKLPKIPVSGLRWLVVIVLAVVALSGSFFTIDPEEVGVITRFGAFARTVQPGLNFKIPLGVERLFKVAVQRQLKQEFGFRTLRPGVKSQFTTTGYGDESEMLTGDLNAAVVEWVVQYRIIDPYKFLFKVRAVEDTFRDLSEAVMRKIVGDRTVNEVLTVGRQEIELLVKEELQALADQYQTGIRVDQVVLQDVNPPDAVKPSFNKVNQAEQEKERLINEAQSEYNKVIPRAEGEARQAVQQAEGYALDRVNRAQGDVARFNALYLEYRKAPEVTRTRIYLETMGKILPKAGQKIVVDEGLDGVIPLLNFDGMPVPRSADAGGGS